MSPAPLVLVLTACSAEQRYERILARVDAPGGQLSVLDASGARWSGSAGVARPGIPTSEQTPMLIGSNTKMFTAAVVLQLVDEGRLSLDDSASAWIPALDPAVTVRALLQHTSGLGEYSASDVMVRDDAAAMQQPWAPEELIALGQEVAHDPPGDRVRYANTNYIALGLMIEALEGEPVDRVLARRIVEPLELEHTGLLVAEPPAGVAWGDGGAWGGPSLWDPSVGWSAGAGYATTADLARFLQAVFAEQLYPRELLDEQLEPARWDELDGDGVDLSYGLGMIVADVGGATYYGHQGGLAGFTSLSLFDPESGAIIADAFNGTEVDVVSPGFSALRIAARQ